MELTPVEKRPGHKPPPKVSDTPRATDLLKEVLEATRVRSMSGWQRGRCLACNHPHPHFRVCECPHHSALAYLKELGIEVEM